MKKLFSFFVLVLAMLSTSTAVKSQSWDFLSLDAVDQENLAADQSGNWLLDTNNNNRWCYVKALHAEAVMANGTELQYAKGLLITVTESSSGNFRADIKNKRMWMGGGSITIPSLKAGHKVTVIYMSSSKDVARGINVENITPVSGEFNSTSMGTARVTSIGTVTADGDVTLTMTGGMYIYGIQVEEPDGDGDTGGGDDTPTPPVTDHSTFASAASNQVVITVGSEKKYYNTAEVTSIDVNDQTITVSQATGTDTYEGTISNISFRKATEGNNGTFDNADGKVRITEARGWMESAYVKFDPFDGARTYHVYVKGGNYADYTLIDAQLVRNYGTYGRADMVGLVKAANYALKIVPVDADGAEMTAAANEAAAISVEAYDRSGFAHKGRTEGVGAYNNDGSLKSNARVVYVTKNNAKTVTLDIVKDSKGTTETFTGLQDIIYGYQKGFETRPLAIRIVGTITAADCDEFLSSSEGIQVKGKGAYSPLNITIEGIGNDAVTTGFGFLIRNSASIELRNFANMLCMDDAVSIDTDNEHIWVHNLDMFYGQPGSDADQKKGDGTIDIKGDSRYITVSYNHLWDSGKASLCGMKSETGPNWIAYHHNWFDHSDSRHPRIRTMSVHVYNNFFDGNAKYGVGAAYQSNAFVERNYFRNCKYPMLISQQGSDVATNAKGTFSGEDGGMVKSFGNKIIGATRYVTYQQNGTQFDAYEAATRDEQVPASVKAVKGGRTYDNFDTNSSLFYTYTPDEADAVPGIVTGWLGAGRMGHGDLQWTFNNAFEDKNAEVIDALKNALENYKSTLVGIFGEEELGPGGDTPGGDTPGGDTPGGDTPEGTITCTFDKSGVPSSDFFIVSGTGSNSKGKATVDGVEYTVCLKIETATSIKFTLPKSYEMTLYFGDTETASIKVDGVKKTSTTSTYTEVLAAGSHELTKADSRNLFFIKLVPKE